MKVASLLFINETEDAMKNTITAIMTACIIAGLSNDSATDVTARRCKAFQPRKHAHYASWYRARLVREGVITARFAQEHR